MYLSSRIFRLLLTIGVGIGVLIILHYTHILRPVENVLTMVLVPVQKQLFTWSTRIHEWYGKRVAYDALIVENKSLEERVSSLLLHEVTLEELRRENEELKTLLDFKHENSFEIEPATIIGHTIDGLQNTYLINRGRFHGIMENYPVVAYNGILIGKIIKVHERTSIIRLSTDNESNIAVTVLNENKTIGLLNGRYNLYMSMNLIPKSETIYKDMIVITSGIEHFIPRGLVVGRIDFVNEEAGELFKSAIVRPLISFDRLVTIGVIKPQSI